MLCQGFACSFPLVSVCPQVAVIVGLALQEQPMDYCRYIGGANWMSSRPAEPSHNRIPVDLLQVLAGGLTSLDVVPLVS